jgi:hypothetical protein
MIMATSMLLLGVSSALAQNQEQKLMDRLLRPNMETKNPAQDKKFTNTRFATFDKPAQTRTFYAPEKTVARDFPQDRVFTPQQFAARHFRVGDSTANIQTRSQITKSDTVYPATAAPGSRVAAPEAVQTTATRDFSGNRPFLVEGKSQKALHAHDKALTIEQVRELLNKSK